MSKCISLRGDWRKLRHKFDRLTDLGQEMADRMLYNVASHVKDELHRTVTSNPYPTNAPSTGRRKGHRRPLEETGGMAEDSVIVSKEEVVKWGVTYDAYVIKGNPNKFHRRTDTSYDDILSILERGDGRRIPGRYAMTMTYDRMKPMIEQYMIKEVQNFLYY